MIEVFSDDLPRRVCLVGGGRMGGAILRGWLDDPRLMSCVSVVEPYPGEALSDLCAQHKVPLAPRYQETVKPDVLLLAVKPDKAIEVGKELEPLVWTGTTVVSIMAGFSLAGLRQLFPRAGGIIRAMPNLASSVGRGMTVATCEALTPSVSRAQAELLFEPAGAFAWLDTEAQLDSGTAISGSGPAYLFLFVEYLARAGRELGLPPQVAATLARRTAIGAGAILDADDAGVEELRAAVTSPGGTTEAALEVLERKGELATIVEQAAGAAFERACALARSRAAHRPVDILHTVKAQPQV